MLEKINGIILKTQDYGETNKIVTIFSQQLGKFSGIARGAKKPKSRMAAITQPFIHGNFLVYVSTGLSTIQQGEVTESFRNIREDIIKTAYAAYMTEFTDKLLESHQPDPYIFNQFCQTMQWISEKDHYEIPLMMFEMKLFHTAGIAPKVDQCVNCGQQDSLSSFSMSEGGLLCSDCFSIDPDAVILPASVSKLLNIFSEVDIERVGNISVKEENKLLLRNLLNTYYDRYGSYFLKSRKFLEQLDLLK